MRVALRSAAAARSGLAPKAHHALNPIAKELWGRSSRVEGVHQRPENCVGRPQEGSHDCQGSGGSLTKDDLHSARAPKPNTHGTGPGGPQTNTTAP